MGRSGSTSGSISGSMPAISGGASTAASAGTEGRDPVVVVIDLAFRENDQRIALVLAAYDVLLIAAVLMLEQHYVIDIIAGFVVAGLAIAISGGPFRSTSTEPAPTPSGNAA